MNRRIDQLGKEAVRPAAKQEPAAAKTESASSPRPEAAPAKSAPASPKAEKDYKAKVHVVEKGETIYGISRRYGIPADQIFKLNHLSPKDPIRPGQKLLGPASKRTGLSPDPAGYLPGLSLIHPWRPRDFYHAGARIIGSQLTQPAIISFLSTIS
jgi:LysM repeat protein